MSNPTKIRHSFSCLFKIENKKKNKLSQMRQLVLFTHFEDENRKIVCKTCKLKCIYSFCRRKMKNRLQNEHTRVLHFMLNEKTSPKRRQRGCFTLLHGIPSPKHRLLKLFHILFHGNPKTGNKKLKSELISTFCTMKTGKTVTKSETTLPEFI